MRVLPDFVLSPKKRLQVASLHNISPACDIYPCPHRHVCPVPYTKVPFVYAEKLQKRIDALEQARPDKQYHLTFVTVNPLERNIHSDMVESAITAEELFK